MSMIAYSRLFIGSERVITVSGGQIHVLNSTTGEVISQSPTLEGFNQEKATFKGPIIVAAVNEDSTHLLTVGENKMLSLWRLPVLELVNERELPKRPTGLAFTNDSQTIIVSDKFGDVFSYPFDYIPPTTRPTRDEFSSHDNPSDGQLVLGHASPVNGFLLSQDEKYIITADRDEHIRVSWYPQGYNVEMYCLGHRKYVSAIHIPKFAPETLISGGGDPCLKIWNWMTGQCTGEVQVWNTVEPFVAVKNNKRKRGGDADEEEGGATEKRKGKGKKSKKRAAKSAAQAKEGDEVEGEGAEKYKQGAGNEGTENNEEVVEVIEEMVLVVSKIDSVQRKDVEFVMFSVIGVTALFGFQYPIGSIEHFEFGHPVIDFSLDNDGRIWVSLDTNLSAAGTGPTKGSTSVRAVQFTEGGKLVEVSSSVNQPLLKRLQETTVRGTKEKTLDFYADLKGMPKWSEPSTQVATVEAEDDAMESVSDNTVSKPLTRRKEARMKNKKNVLAKMRKAQNEPAGEKEKVGTVRPFEDVESGDDEETETRETKRTKSVIEGSGDANVEIGT